jgi:hypothetical protein
MWDQTILGSHQPSSSISGQLLFRAPGSLANLAYLYQILEMAYIC